MLKIESLIHGAVGPRTRDCLVSALLYHLTCRAELVESGLVDEVVLLPVGLAAADWASRIKYKICELQLLVRKQDSVDLILAGGGFSHDIKNLSHN